MWKKTNLTFAYLFNGHGSLSLDPVHEVKVAHLVVVGGADAHVVVCNFTIIQISLQKMFVSPFIHTEVVDHGAAGGDDVALLYVHVVAVARDDRVEHLRLLRVLLPQEGPLIAVTHLPARYNLACK